MMKHSALLLCFLFPALFGFSQKSSAPEEPFRNVENNAFRVGEYLKYRIHYGIIDAGIAELEVTGKTMRNNRPVYHMVGKGRSVGMAEWFFRTRDRYETYMDTEAMIPWEFVRDVDEGGYIIKRHLIFDHYKDEVKDLEKSSTHTYSIAENAQDMLSTFYYARCLKTENLEVGEMLPVEMFMDHEPFAFQLKFLGIEYVDTEWGKVRCKKLVPVVQEGRVFRDKEGLLLWVTDDENKIPVRLQADIAVGSIKMDLIDYKNIRHSIDFK